MNDGNVASLWSNLQSIGVQTNGTRIEIGEVAKDIPSDRRESNSSTNAHVLHVQPFG